MTQPCGCCEGTRVLTPLSTANRPGLSKLSFRVGTHAAFLETMNARLSSSDFPELAGLRTHDPGDMSIALLDAWATVADVLTFYQERIANEGYLRTATERRSILELARLVGYNLRPGVAASVYLAFTLEKDCSADIPAGTRAQSVPGPGEKLQPFETSEQLKARSEWSSIKPRLSRPMQISMQNVETIDTIYFQGISTKLRANDPLLFIFNDDPSGGVLRRVKEVEPQKAEGRTKVTLQFKADAFNNAFKQVVRRYFDLEDSFCISRDMAKDAEEILRPLLSNEIATRDFCERLGKLEKIQKNADDTRLKKWISSIIDEFQKILDEMPSNPCKVISKAEAEEGTTKDLSRLLELVEPVSKPPLLQPANSQRLTRAVKQVFNNKQDTVPQLLSTLKPSISPDIYSAWANYALKKIPRLEVYALRLIASVFGANAPPVMHIDREKGIITLTDDQKVDKKVEKPNTIYLDNSYEKILKDSWIVVETHDTGMTKEHILISKAGNPQAGGSRTGYGINSKTTIIGLDSEWIKLESGNGDNNDFNAIRKTVVYAQSELLTLAEEPVQGDICGKSIELGAIYPGLQSGSWVIVSGERTDIPNTSGVKASELVILAGVEQSSDPDSTGSGTEGASVRSRLILDKGLAYTYDPQTVSIYANVVKATHGETKKEVLGSGDSGASFQQFLLRQPPLTYLAAATPAGAESTLQVRVNGILWHEAEGLFDLGPKDRSYATKTDDASKTTVIFGNGHHGARPPTGLENVTSVYRTGIGRPGNVQAGQIRLLAAKPPGVKAVVNPLRASGGSDKEGRDQGRRNAPLATMALDRLVSVEDYAFFVRNYAGIGKASAAFLTDGHRQLVHLTIAGNDDIPIDTNSDLFRNLSQALHQFGDPFQPVQVAIRELKLLVISAKVRLLPDYLWEKVEPQIRSALLDAFGFDRRELGQSAFLSEAVSVIQQVDGVDYVDMVVFDSVSDADLAKLASLASLERKSFVEVKLAKLNDDPINTDPTKLILPAQLAYLSPNVKDTLILNPVELTK
jgi:hypothetical protein